MKWYWIIPIGWLFFEIGYQYCSHKKTGEWLFSKKKNKQKKETETIDIKSGEIKSEMQ